MNLSYRISFLFYFYFIYCNKIFQKSKSKNILFQFCFRHCYTVTNSALKQLSITFDSFFMFSIKQFSVA
uniref:Uncharacterized protein n=1 Tax=Siphoviridae sp. ctHip2 TaxID=2827830 RepID=A0A8S5RVP9_9CAUD|nr:MAG TPA: hypothetical protein [Siphoviridae sp. ctHip2]